METEDVYARGQSMLRIRYLSSSSSSSIPLSPRKALMRSATQRLRCRAEAEPSVAECALVSHDDRVRRWGVTELVRQRPDDGGQDAMRCSVLARFARSHSTADQHALLDAVDVYGASPRMLPIFQELMTSRCNRVRLRTAPLLSALVGLFELSASRQDDAMFTP